MLGLLGLVALPFVRRGCFSGALPRLSRGRCGALITYRFRGSFESHTTLRLYRDWSRFRICTQREEAPPCERALCYSYSCDTPALQGEARGPQDTIARTSERFRARQVGNAGAPVGYNSESFDCTQFVEHAQGRATVPEFLQYIAHEGNIHQSMPERFMALIENIIKASCYDQSAWRGAEVPK